MKYNRLDFGGGQRRRLLDPFFSPMQIMKEGVVYFEQMQMCRVPEALEQTDIGCPTHDLEKSRAYVERRDADRDIVLRCRPFSN